MKKQTRKPDARPEKYCGLIAIVGRTNAGKSTLLNRLIGEKVSIISDKPQTTRTRVLGVLTSERGQAVFIDTPGVHRPGHELNRGMVQAIYEALRNAEVLLHIVDISQSFGQGEQFVLDMVKNAGRPAVLVLNKIDLVKKSKILESIDFYRHRHDYRAFVPISALSGDGVAELLAEVFPLLPAGDYLYDEDFVTDSPERFLAAELVREKILQHTHDELPFTAAVQIEAFDESRRETDGLVRLEATIVVERASQKAIVIGAGGKMLKQIGIEARQEIEAMLGCRVFLGLFVKVEENWRNNPRVLRQLGILQ